MYHIELTKEPRQEFRGINGLKSMIEYAFNPRKTFEDNIRNISGCCDYTGCSPFFFTEENEHDSEWVFQQMLLVINAFQHASDGFYGTMRGISFHPADLVLPCHLNEIGRQIINYYCQKGFVAAYGVHLNTCSLHLHIVICNTSYINGASFIPWNEYQALDAILRCWYLPHEDRLQKDLAYRAMLENQLYGDDCLKYSQIPLSAADQIKLNKQNNFGRILK